MPTQTTSSKKRTQDKIQSARVAERLLKHFNGELELSHTQCTVGLKLLSKVLPDLKHIEKDGKETLTVVVSKETTENLARGVRAVIKKG